MEYQFHHECLEPLQAFLQSCLFSVGTGSYLAVRCFSVISIFKHLFTKVMKVLDLLHIFG